MNKLAILLIKLYQFALSPLLGDNCRFYPSCSSYTLEAFKVFPFYKALWYSAIRISKCHPFNDGGHDPLPVLEKKI